MNEHSNAEPSMEDEEFARQLAAVLRASDERPGSGFDDRVMAAVRAVHALTPTADQSSVAASSASSSASSGAPSNASAEASVTPISTWHRRRTLALPPMAWGALAAGFAIIVSLGTLATAHIIRRQPTAVATAAKPVDVAAVPEPVRHEAPVVPAATVSHIRHDTVYMVRFVLADADAHTVSLVGDFNEWEKRATPLRSAKPGVWTAQVALPPGRHEYAYVVDGQRWVADPAADNVADDFDTPSSVVTVGRDGMGGK